LRLPRNTNLQRRIDLPVPSSDRVLIHLLKRRDPRGWTGGVSDQDLISSECGIGRTHVPRVIKPLLDDGTVIEDIGRSPGRQRRVKVYSLSETGLEVAEEVHRSTISMEMRWTDEEGLPMEGSIDACYSSINNKLGALSMKVIPLSLFLSLPIEDLKWNDIIWTSTSIKKEGVEGPCTPKGWRSFHLKDRIEGKTFSTDILKKIDEIMDREKMVILKGVGGSGKKDLIELWTRSRSKKALWLEKGEGEEGVCIEGGPFDVLVMLGGGDPGVEHLLLDSNQVKDPRKDDWPAELKEMDLIMTTDVKLDMGGPVVEVQGLEKDFFMDICLKKGISETLTEKIFNATKGSSRGLRNIVGSSKEEIIRLNMMDEDEAVLSILIWIK
jgi:hypothetical protein